jgi:hypothetical protein
LKFSCRVLRLMEMMKFVEFLGNGFDC